MQHAALDPAILSRLRPGQDPDAAPLDADGVALPATATPRQLLMGLGGLMMLIALVWLIANRERRLW